MNGKQRAVYACCAVPLATRTAGAAVGGDRCRRRMRRSATDRNDLVTAPALNWAMFCEAELSKNLFPPLAAQHRCHPSDASGALFLHLHYAPFLSAVVTDQEPKYALGLVERSMVLQRYRVRRRPHGPHLFQTPVTAMENCPQCNGALTRVDTVVDARLGRRTIDVPGQYDGCQGICREVYFLPGEADDFMRRATDLLHTQEGMLPPQEIRGIRARYDLTQEQLKRLLNVGPKTVARWERGMVFQNSATDTLLRLLRDVPAVYPHLLRERERGGRAMTLAITPSGATRRMD